MVPLDKLAQITQRFEFLEAKLNAGASPAEIATLSREYSDLKPVADEIAAYRRAPAIIVAPMQYSQIIWAVIFGFFIFGESVDLWTGVGTTIIVASPFDNATSAGVSGITIRCSIVPCSRSRSIAAPVRAMVSNDNWFSKEDIDLNQTGLPLALNARRSSSRRSGGGVSVLPNRNSWLSS